MEAKGKFDFNGSAEDELSFRKGDVLKILGSQDEWFKAELHGHEGFVPKNYVDRPVPSWFQESASRNSAEDMLMSKDVGSFLIRGSQSSPGDFSISVRHENDVQHFKVLKEKSGQYYLWTEKFMSLNKLVEFYKTTSISRQREVFLRDGSLEEPRPAPPIKSQPDNRPPHGGGYGGPQTSGQQRVHDQIHNQKTKWEDRTNTGACARRNSPTLPAPMPTVRVRAIYDFKAEEDDELGFYADDIIEVLNQSEPSWWKGRLNGRTGLFPSNYTELI